MKCLFVDLFYAIASVTAIWLILYTLSTVTGMQILFQYAARHGALTVHDLLAAIEASDEEGDTSMG